ncbi:Cys-tRNA(Pro) deacylase [Tannockella kyphosi]|uniref:Cys-tRNA(Pro) deacylase n=1 Tax=Tannockella kyphosi TaxID=2899121 RepID=UPI0020116336|nr:Cys-tRNA(Pro) deacylase [Tannockella kyphosi]
MNKTNAMRLLDAAKISYTTREYVVAEDNYFGVQVAKNFKMSADQVFKTLVTKGDKNGYNIFCIPINCELDLKKAAIVSKNKKIEMILMKDLLQVTGYIRGGCSPIGMKKKFPTYIDETAMIFEEIGISAGVRGCEIVLSGYELCAYLEATFHDLS